MHPATPNIATELTRRDHAASGATGTQRRLRRYVAAVVCCAAASLAHAQDPIPGSLDTTPSPGFAAGTGKVLNLAIGSGNDQANAVAVQPDGKIVLAGHCFSGSNFDFCAARLNVDGTLDTSFNGPSGTGNGKFLLPIGPATDQANAVALQADGKIVLAGHCSDGNNFDFCVARLNTDGTLDTSFNGPSGTGAGQFLLPIGSATDQATAVALQPDGKIVLAGYCVDSGNFDFCVARLNTDGTLDTSFNGPSGTGAGKFVLPVGTSSDQAAAVALQLDGKIVLAGACINGATPDLCVARLNPDGSLDTSFNGPSGTGAGKFLLPVGPTSDQANAIALQPDGKIVLAGTCYSGSNFDFCAARLNTDGTLDTSFNGPSGSGNGKFLLPIGTASDQATAVAVQPDGRIVLAGYCYNGSNNDFCVARLRSDGALDRRFDGPSGTGNGQFLLPMGANTDQATAMALQPDGKIVLAGHCFSGADFDFCAARLNGGSFGAHECSPDYDGDGSVLATTDALMLTRIALGITGEAVIGGITFAANAARKTWPDIRSFLVNQCGMTIAP
ncbi:MAG TPA: delta-60 repeat domain-containing protein [Casimicrobium sp.]|nr:delta-60 repeat domain-containing protein [Casimicrobium sp.]